MTDLGTGAPVYAPHKDIVVPGYVSRTRSPAAAFEREAPIDLIHAGGVRLTPLTRRRARLPQPLALGSQIWGWSNRGPHKVTAYSLGMRQRLWELYGPNGTARTPRILVVNYTLRGPVWFRTKFCYSPAGGARRQHTRSARDCVE